MDETRNAPPYAWDFPACKIEPRVTTRMPQSKSSEKAGVDIERAVSLWSDTVLRLALCKTGNIADAEDVTQTVFMKLCQNRPVIESDEHMKAWLLQVTIRCTADLYRSPWKNRRMGYDDVEASADRSSIAPSDSPFCDSDRSHRQAAVARAVSSLPEKQRIAVHLHYFEGYSTNEIARITEEKPSTVRSHLHRARTSLKTMMGGIDE